ncbi:MAG: gamma-glutamylcyclotransferase [Pseudomonadales bacterium]|nr:gamma-glutamylcyclotransferase [Pseudomonadales bacterium]
MSDPLWIFGYGSLIWRVDFPFVRSVPAWIYGWSRRFWQGSTDHRGLPGAPGRVVTLTEALNERCDGMAYLIDPTLATGVLDALDYREKGGYERLTLPLHFLNEHGEHQQVTGITYLATELNPEYLGPASNEDLARQIWQAHGPSGSNEEYLFELERALLALNCEDHHVAEIAASVRRLKSGLN